MLLPYLSANYLFADENVDEGEAVTLYAFEATGGDSVYMAGPTQESDQYSEG